MHSSLYVCSCIHFLINYFVLMGTYFTCYSLSASYMHANICMQIYACKCFLRFSRTIIWLELSTTNNDPGVVAQYYLEALFQLGGRFVAEIIVVCSKRLLTPLCVCVCVCVCVTHTILSGCPARMRSDHGTENFTIATCQMAFRHYHDDRYAGAHSFMFGSSIRELCKLYW